MKKLLLGALIALGSVVTCSAADVVDYYTLTMYLKVPRVYNNTESLGYRKLQTQRIVGELKVTYPEGSYRPIFEVTNLYNKTHKLSNGKNVTYTTYVKESDPFPRLNVIGNNKTGKFSQGTIVFGIEADPSYNIGDLEEDNTLILDLSGFGKASKWNGCSVIKYMTGLVTGQLGCGCTAYGHLSPTRLWWWYGVVYNTPDDVAAVNGRFSLVLNKEKSCR